MDTELLSRIEVVREALWSDPDGVLIGDLPPGIVPPADLLGLQEYVEFVLITDGARCGEVQLFPCCDLRKHQSGADFLDGGLARWLIVGGLLTQGVAIDRRTQFVHIVDPIYQRTDYAVFSRFDDFLSALFGVGYLQVVGLENDRWSDLLKRLKLA